MPFSGPRERVHWSCQTVEKMLDRAYYDGLEAGDCPRGLREFLQALVAEEAGNAARIYGELVYIFGGTEDGDELKLLLSAGSEFRIQSLQK